MMAARTSSCISARWKAQGCTASTKDRQFYSTLLQIEGPASRPHKTCALPKAARGSPALTADVLAKALAEHPAPALPATGFLVKEEAPMATASKDRAAMKEQRAQDAKL